MVLALYLDVYNSYNSDNTGTFWKSLDYDLLKLWKESERPQRLVFHSTSNQSVWVRILLRYRIYFALCIYVICRIYSANKFKICNLYLYSDGRGYGAFLAGFASKMSENLVQKFGKTNLCQTLRWDIILYMCIY